MHKERKKEIRRQRHKVKLKQKETSYLMSAIDFQASGLYVQYYWHAGNSASPGAL
jgi:hypothetical protein